MSNGQTIIQYGNVKLFRCLIREFRQEPMLDASGTDLRCWRFTVRVSGYLHGHHGASGDSIWRRLVEPMATRNRNGDTIGGSAALTHTCIRYQLVPRQPFRLIMGANDNGTGGDVVGGDIALAGNPFTPDVSSPVFLGSAGITDYDVNNGPVCTEFTVTNAAANEVWKIEATFVVCKVECDSGGMALGATSGVLSHRWSSVDSLDVNRMTTRTYSGSLTIATANFSPHWFRYLVVPPLQGGFRREAQRFEASDDGLQLRYSITDREVAQAAPYPATKWQVAHTEGARNGMMGFGALQVALWGDGMCDKHALITLGLSLVDALLFVGDDPNAPTYIIDEISITDHIGDEQFITLAASVRKIGTTLNKFQMDVKNLGKPIDQSMLPALPADYEIYDPKKSRGSRNFDEPEYHGPIDLVGIFRCYLQGPCGGDHRIAPGVAGSDQNGYAASIPRFEASVIPTSSFPEIPPSYDSADHLSAAYTYYRVESIYDTHNMRAAMPIALGPRSSGSSGPDTRDTTVIVSFAPPQQTRRIRIRASRIGQQPKLPDPEKLEESVISAGGGLYAKMVCLRSRLHVATDQKTATGQSLWVAGLDAKYSISRRLPPSISLPIGNNLWTNDGLQKTTTNVTDGDSTSGSS